MVRAPGGPELTLVSRQIPDQNQLPRIGCESNAASVIGIGSPKPTSDASVR